MANAAGLNWPCEVKPAARRPHPPRPPPKSPGPAAAAGAARCTSASGTGGAWRGKAALNRHSRSRLPSTIHPKTARASCSWNWEMAVALGGRLWAMCSKTRSHGWRCDQVVILKPELRTCSCSSKWPLRCTVWIRGLASTCLYHIHRHWV